MSGVPTTPLGEIMAEKARSVDPTKHPTETFDLYSIPAFDRGTPDVVAGNMIGSAKQSVEPGDVLLSKIVPHIRRAWVVGEPRGRRLIASGEWIVFRGDRFHPGYLRHVLMGNPFHAQFMSTVSGVGGSLLRARPAYVAQIRIPFPPLPVQRRIAATLDLCEALRAKRRAALASLDALAQSLFVEMFGDPTRNPMGWPKTSLGKLISTGPQNGLYKPASEYGSGTPILRIDGFCHGAVTDLGSLKRVRISAKEKATYALRAGEIVINRVNSREYLGKSALVPAMSEAVVFESNMMRFDANRDVVDPGYLIQYLQSGFVRGHIAMSAKDAVNQSSINQEDVRSLPVILPALAKQRLFSKRVAGGAQLRMAFTASLAQMEALFASLRHSAFCGEL